MSDYNTIVETYVEPITVDYPDWVNFVSSGKNLMFNEAIRLGPSMGGAVIPGHVRQNFMTADKCPYCNQFETLAPEDQPII
jgi:hypothetical protein